MKKVKLNINSYINEISNKILENENQKKKYLKFFSVLKKLNKITLYVFSGRG